LSYNKEQDEVMLSYTRFVNRNTFHETYRVSQKHDDGMA